jgi:fructokinase
MRIGVDLGGTKIEALALGDGDEELARRRVATPRDDYEATVAGVRELVFALESDTGRTGSVGIGHPGTVSPASGRIKNANSTWLNDRPLAEDLTDALGRELRLANDANCFALSEATDGAAAGTDIVFGVILGTGVGGGIVVHGEILTGVNAISGEWGHNPLPWPAPEEWPGPDCWCARTGCIETLLSGPGLRADFARATGETVEPPEIDRRATGGDDAAAAALGRYCDRLARALAAVINTVDPGVIVLGGGMSNLQRLYTEVPALWGAYVFSDRVETRLAPPVHGDSSGVRGAARLWPA